MHMRSANGLRLVAIFEACKGLLVLAAGFGILSFRHRDAQDFAEQAVRHLHLDPFSRYPHIFIQLAGNVSSSQLWSAAALAFAYAAVRLTEAYGLWQQRRWAEWFAVASGGIYLPLEIYELFRGFSWLKLIAFLLNALIVLYMIYMLRQQQHGINVAPAS